MENHKVKYNRFEYREEYLKSPEWQLLRKTVMDASCDCALCKEKANDVHHLVYRNLVDVKVTDLIPVCRKCHDLIHEAIDNFWISQEPTKIEEITQVTLGILNDEKYLEWKAWLDGKHYLTAGEIELISSLQAFVIKKISSIIKRNIWYQDLKEVKFTGRQLLQIKKVIQVAIFRRKNKIDFLDFKVKFGGKFGITS